MEPLSASPPNRPADPQPGIAAAGALRARLRAAAEAGARATPSPSWGERERQALDALRALSAFLHHHGNTAVAQAITRELRST